MTRDWKESAQRQIRSEVADVLDSLNETLAEAQDISERLLNTVEEDEPEVDEVIERLEELRDVARDAGGQGYEMASDIQSLIDADLRSTLRGNEPPGYSSPDGGAAYDAYHGAKGQDRHFRRKLAWPLDLSEWDKEKCKMTGDSVMNTQEFHKIKVEGTEVYRKRIGGVPVVIVLDHTKAEPPI